MGFCIWWICLVSDNLCWYIFEKAKEVNDMKRRVENNIQNKAVQTKFNLYIKKYIQKETLQML